MLLLSVLSMESISGLEPSSVIIEPRYLKLVAVSSFCPFILITVLMPLVLFVISVVWLCLSALKVLLKAELQRRIQAMEMRCYLKILHISYKDHVTNEGVYAKIQQAIGPHKDLLAIVKRRKVQWYGHVSRSPGLAKTILQGTVKGGRRQGRQRKRWEDNIREWTGLEFGKS